MDQRKGSTTGELRKGSAQDFETMMSMEAVLFQAGWNESSNGGLK